MVAARSGQTQKEEDEGVAAAEEPLDHLTVARVNDGVTEEELKAQEPEEGSALTYSQEYYILNREDILAKRREKELEAKFGDFSARLVKRPKKNFMWGFGTQMHEDKKTEHGKCVVVSRLPAANSRHSSFYFA